jgi:para-aminobenzoate synthetase component I
MLNWSARFNIFVFLDSQEYQMPHHEEEWLAAAGAFNAFTIREGQALSGLDEFVQSAGDWLFGHISYDLKNTLDSLRSRHADKIGFPLLQFFVPQIICKKEGNRLLIGTTKDSPQDVWNSIQASSPLIADPQATGVSMQQRLSRSQYLEAVQWIKSDIARGNCYEINFCQEFYVEEIQLDPVRAYHKLATVSPNPFSAYYHNGNAYLLCASPERYLKKSGSKILSQPIKGTIARALGEGDAFQKNQLLENPKERSENVMIVDLVRNDLSKVCKQGTVVADELFGIYTFPQVHQMISTIRGELRPEVGFTEILQASFPMGSMTGAPKRKVMELIDRYEPARRGLYSGALGYIDPSGDFDFNVVIRSMLYNEGSGYLSFPAGSAITHHSDPEQEYEECLLKAAAMRMALE